jgi:crotonobetainyl-CoA:carnitine CoA-transferase CaiB-like acyl-CoA transferase
VLSVAEALDNEQTRARGTVTELADGDRTVPVVEHPLRFAGADSGFEAPPPKLGEHTREVFRERGHDEDALDELAARGAFGERADGEADDTRGDRDGDS